MYGCVSAGATVFVPAIAEEEGEEEAAELDVTIVVPFFCKYIVNMLLWNEYVVITTDTHPVVLNFIKIKKSSYYIDHSFRFFRHC